MKTKNAAKDLKYKINHTFFFGNRGSQKGGGGGSDIWEKFPKNPVFLGGGVSYSVKIKLPVKEFSEKKWQTGSLKSEWK